MIARQGVLCIGALNYDTIAIGTTPRSVITLLPNETKYQPYTEMLVSDDLATAIGAEVEGGSLPFSHQLGGSAFNVMRVLAAFATNLRLGFVGSAGCIGMDWPHANFLSEKGVDTTFVWKSTLPPARSIAFSADDDRTLFTSVGANRNAAKGFHDHRRELPEYIASFDTTHVTSFLDTATPTELGRVIGDAIALNPSLRVSVDPGHAWCSNPSSGARTLIKSASMLHLNYLEFTQLGGRLGNEDNERVADRIHRMMRPDGRRTVLLRTHNAVVHFSDDGYGRLETWTVPNEEVVPPGLVVDSTGAGDAFTGGFLGVLASHALLSAIATRVGASVARAKVRQEGPLDSAGILRAVEQVAGDTSSILAPRPDRNLGE